MYVIVFAAIPCRSGSVRIGRWLSVQCRSSSTRIRVGEGVRNRHRSRNYRLVPVILPIGSRIILWCTSCIFLTVSGRLFWSVRGNIAVDDQSGLVGSVVVVCRVR